MDYQQGREILELLNRIWQNTSSIDQALNQLVATRRQKERQNSEKGMKTLRQLGDEWFDLGASARVANTMARSGISPAKASEMSDKELRHVRVIGKKGLAEIREILIR